MAVLNFTSREFRSQQAHVFELADQGEKVIILGVRSRLIRLFRYRTMILPLLPNPSKDR